MLPGVLILIDGLMQLFAADKTIRVWWSYGLQEILASLLAMSGLWMVFRKAARPGWASLVPVYGDLTLLRITGLRSRWIYVTTPSWLLLFLFECTGLLADVERPGFVHFVVLAVNIILSLGCLVTFAAVTYLGDRFRKGIPYCMGLFFFPVIFLPILGFGSAVYTPLHEKRLRPTSRRSSVQGSADR